jgi:hypothetical protein
MIITQRYVLGLMAICYRYLGERALVERTCSMIPKAGEGLEERLTIDGGYGILTNYLSPSFYKQWLGYGLGYARDENSEPPYEKYAYDITAFRTNLERTW